jgi:hypothetical protein
MMMMRPRRDAWSSATDAERHDFALITCSTGNPKRGGTRAWGPETASGATMYCLGLTEARAVRRLHRDPGLTLQATRNYRSVVRLVHRWPGHAEAPRPQERASHATRPARACLVRSGRKRMQPSASFESTPAMRCSETNQAFHFAGEQCSSDTFS